MNEVYIVEEIIGKDDQTWGNKKAKAKWKKAKM